MNRKGMVRRTTSETDVTVELTLEGKGASETSTGIRIFDHFLDQLARHGFFDLKVSAAGADPHHVVEDVAIVLGRALNEALGERRGVQRMGWAVIPMDEALVLVALDLDGRGYARIEAPREVPGLPPGMVGHFLRTLAIEGKMSLHTKIISGEDAHHIAEALFKGLARALSQAVAFDPRLQDVPPSTKGIIG